MSSLPADIDFVLNPAASPQRMNVAMALLHARLNALELPAKTFSDELAQLQTIGLERINDALQPYYQQLAAVVAQYIALTAAQHIDGGTFSDPNTRIGLRRSTLTGEAPTSLLDGEVAINEADGILYWSDASGTIRSLSLALNSLQLTGEPTAPTAPAGDGTTRIATTAFVGAAISALKAGVDPAYDTLLEIAAKLGSDDTAIASMLTSIANRVRVDAAQGLTGSQQLQARNNIAAQQADAELTALAGLVSAADQLPYFTGLGAAALTTLSPFARTVIDDANGATMYNTMGAGFSASGNGYQKLPSGLLIQWGFTAGSGAKTFNITFPNAVFSLQLMLSGSDAGVLYSASQSGLSKSGFTLVSRFVSAGSVGDTGETTYWLAIGY